MGEGPTNAWGPNIHPGVHKALKEAAGRVEVPLAMEPLPAHSGTDAFALRIAGEFVAATEELSELGPAISRRTAIRRPGRGAPGVESPASRKENPDDVRRIAEAVPAGAAAGTRYPEAMMRALSL